MWIGLQHSRPEDSSSQLTAAEFRDREDCLPLLEWALPSAVCVHQFWVPLLCTDHMRMSGDFSIRWSGKRKSVDHRSPRKYIPYSFSNKKKKQENMKLWIVWEVFIVCNKRFWEPFPNTVKRDPILTSGCSSDVSKNVTETLVSGLLLRCFKLWFYVSTLGASWGRTMFSSCWRTSLVPSTVPGM